MCTRNAAFVVITSLFASCSSSPNGPSGFDVQSGNGIIRQYRPGDIYVRPSGSNDPEDWRLEISLFDEMERRGLTGSDEVLNPKPHPQSDEVSDFSPLIGIKVGEAFDFGIRYAKKGRMVFGFHFPEDLRDSGSGEQINASSGSSTVCSISDQRFRELFKGVMKEDADDYIARRLGGQEVFYVQDVVMTNAYAVRLSEEFAVAANAFGVAGNGKQGLALDAEGSRFLYYISRDAALEPADGIQWHDAEFMRTIVKNWIVAKCKFVPYVVSGGTFPPFPSIPVRSVFRGTLEPFRFSEFSITFDVVDDQAITGSIEHTWRVGLGPKQWGTAQFKGTYNRSLGIIEFDTSQPRGALSGATRYKGQVQQSSEGLAIRGHWGGRKVTGEFEVTLAQLGN